jgi:hypothetical protein
MKTAAKTAFSALLLALPLVAPQPAQAFTGNWNYSWGDTKTSSADIGTAVGRTCFLTGVGGDFRPLGAYLYAQGGSYPAKAGVRKNANNHYEIYVQPEAGKHLSAYARCVNSDAGRIEVGWNSIQESSAGDKVIAPVGGGRQCFLQDIQNFAVPMKDNTGATYSFGWAFEDKANPDTVQVINDGAYWKLSVKPGNHSYPVNIAANAVCLNASQSLGSWTWKAADPGTAQINLTNAAGATCGLTGVNGHFDAALGNWSDGVSISAAGSQFKLNLANGKRGWAGCMK